MDCSKLDCLLTGLLDEVDVTVTLGSRLGNCKLIISRMHSVECHEHRHSITVFSIRILCLQCCKRISRNVECKVNLNICLCLKACSTKRTIKLICLTSTINRAIDVIIISIKSERY